MDWLKAKAVGIPTLSSPLIKKNKQAKDNTATPGQSMAHSSTAWHSNILYIYLYRHPKNAINFVLETQ